MGRVTQLHPHLCTKQEDHPFKFPDSFQKMIRPCNTISTDKNNLRIEGIYTTLQCRQSKQKT